MGLTSHLCRPDQARFIGRCFVARPIYRRAALSDLLGTKVDVAIKKNLRKRIGKRILDEVAPV